MYKLSNLLYIIVNRKPKEGGKKGEEEPPKIHELVDDIGRLMHTDSYRNWKHNSS